MSELKPCPACGGTDLSIYRGNNISFVECRQNGCRMGGPFRENKSSAIAAWNALPRHLRWTKQPPTEPGWYFFRGNVPGYQKNNPPVYVDVQKDAVILTRHAPWILSKLIDKYAIEWAGPIQEPVN